MPIYSAPAAGGIVTVYDKNEFLLEPGQWSNGSDVSFTNGACRMARGYYPSLASGFSSPTNQRWAMAGYSAGTLYWYLASNTEVWEWNGSATTERTRTSADYTPGTNDRWTGDFLHGIPIINLRGDVPQYMATPGSGKFQDLIWDGADTWSDENNQCKMLGVYKNFIIACNLKLGANTYADGVLWSDAAEPGSIPSTWDYSSPTNLAGLDTLSDGGGEITACGRLGDDFAIYKKNAIYRLSYVGGDQVMKWERTPSKFGCVGRHAFADIGGAHVVLCADDVYVHSLGNTQSIANGKFRDWIYTYMITIDPEEGYWWVEYDANANNVMVGLGITAATEAATYDLDSGAWSFETLPSVYHAVYAEDNVSDLTGGVYRSMMGATATDLVSINNRSSSSAGINRATSPYVERKGIILDGNRLTVKEATAVIVDPDDFMTSAGIEVYIAGYNYPGATVSYEGPYTLTPDTGYRVNVRASGRYHKIKFESVKSETPNDVQFGFTAYHIEYTQAGNR